MSKHGGYENVAKICGEKWGRLVPVSWAAAYCGMNVPHFRSIGALSDTIRPYWGDEFVDLADVDEAINAEKARLLSEK